MFILWLERLFSLNTNAIARITLSADGWLIFDWIKYRLADGLWVYSLTSLMILIWDCKLGKENIIWICSGLLVAVFSEICQAFGLVPGVFDFGDIVFYFLAFFAACAKFLPVNPITIMRICYEKGTR